MPARPPLCRRARRPIAPRARLAALSVVGAAKLLLGLLGVATALASVLGVQIEAHLLWKIAREVHVDRVLRDVPYYEHLTFGDSRVAIAKVEGLRGAERAPRTAVDAHHERVEPALQRDHRVHRDLPPVALVAQIVDFKRERVLAGLAGRKGDADARVRVPVEGLAALLGQGETSLQVGQAERATARGASHCTDTEAQRNFGAIPQREVLERLGRGAAVRLEVELLDVRLEHRVAVSAEETDRQRLGGRG